MAITCDVSIATERDFSPQHEPKASPVQRFKGFDRRVRCGERVCGTLAVDFHGLQEAPQVADHIPLPNTAPLHSTYGLLFYCGDGNSVGKRLARGVEASFSQPRQRRLTVQPRRASALTDQNQPCAIFEVR